MGNKLTTERYRISCSQERSSVSSNPRSFTIILIWYDPKMNSDLNYEQTKLMLSEITDNVRFYIRENEFLNYIESSKHLSIVLILSGHIVSDILPRIRHLEQIKSVHIYRGKRSLNEQLKPDYPKVKSISNGRTELKHALETTLTHHSVFNYYNSVTQTSTWDLSTKNPEFIWFQLLQQKILLEQKVDHTERSKRDFIQRCREYLGDDYEPDQKYIRYLENDYRPEDAIREYTKNNFLHHLINHAIRTGDIEELYRFRYYVSHLNTNLTKQSEQFRVEQQRLGKTVLILYRGQQLSKEEGEHLRTSGKKYIAMRGFLSTTRDRDTAKSFAEASSDCLAVLFEITVDLDQVPTMVLADVSEFSVMPHEKEVLFGLNAIFEIDRQSSDESGRWNIHIHATNYEQESANDYIKHRQLETSNSSSSPWISINFTVAQLLIEMGHYEKAVKFLEKILPTTDEERANLYYFLADTKISPYRSSEHALNDGIRLLKESTNLFILLKNKRCHANSLRRHADALVLKKEYEKATSKYQQARELYGQIPDQEENIANCYHGLGDIYLRQQKYPQAKSHYLEALKLRQKNLSHEHPAIARSYYSFGCYYHTIGNNNDNALCYLNEALQRKKKIYPPDHPSIQCNERLRNEVLTASKL